MHILVADVWAPHVDTQRNHRQLQWSRWTIRFLRRQLNFVAFLSPLKNRSRGSTIPSGILIQANTYSLYSEALVVDPLLPFFGDGEKATKFSRRRRNLMVQQDHRNCRWFRWLPTCDAHMLAMRMLVYTNL